MMTLAPTSWIVDDGQGDYLVRQPTATAVATVTIGADPYRRRPGVFVSAVYGDLAAECMHLDGTWSKYGEVFNSETEALAVLERHGADGPTRSNVPGAAS